MIVHSCADISVCCLFFDYIHLVKKSSSILNFKDNFAKLSTMFSKKAKMMMHTNFGCSQRILPISQYLLWLLLPIGICVFLLQSCSSTSARTQDSGITSTGREFPCAVKAIMRKCQYCHIKPSSSASGALATPFPLVTYDDTQRTEHDIVITKLISTIVQCGNMPLPPVSISDNERQVLLQWIAQGAQPAPSDEVCVLPDDAGIVFTDANPYPLKPCYADSGTSD